MDCITNTGGGRHEADRTNKWNAQEPLPLRGDSSEGFQGFFSEFCSEKASSSPVFMRELPTASLEQIKEDVWVPNCREGGLDEGGAEPAATLAGLARPMFAGALVVAGAQARPARRMGRSREDPHVDAELGDEDLSRPLRLRAPYANDWPPASGLG